MSLKTKKQIAEYYRAWRKNNKVAQKAHDKAYYEKNKDKKKVHREANPQKIKGNKLRSKYGIELEDYNDMFVLQNGKCAICGKHQTELKKALHIDHCHSTGKIRGLLCGNCNRGIGMLKDDIENLKCAILYLNKTD